MAIVGLDLSPARCGVAILMPEWSAGPDRFVHIESFAPDAEHLIAKAHLAAVLLVKLVSRWKPKHVFIEDYPFANNTMGSRERAEFAGIVKQALWLHNEAWLPTPVNISTARKTLLGDVPQGHGLAKKVVFESLKSLGFALRFDDEADALVVANHAASMLARPFITAASNDLPQPKTRRRRA